MDSQRDICPDCRLKVKLKQFSARDSPDKRIINSAKVIETEGIDSVDIKLSCWVKPFLKFVHVLTKLVHIDIRPVFAELEFETWLSLYSKNFISISRGYRRV